MFIYSGLKFDSVEDVEDFIESCIYDLYPYLSESEKLKIIKSNMRFIVEVV